MGYEAIKEIDGDIYKILGINPNRKLLKSNIYKAAQEIQCIISNELKNRVFCLKMDIATRLNKSCLGVNAQFIREDKIIIRTLGIITLEETHTAENIKKEMENLLKIFKLSMDQVFSITVDNGANMVKTVNIINDEIDNEKDDESDEVSIDKISKAISCVRCAAHTIQLAAHDVFKDERINRKISIIRAISKRGRNPNISRIYKREEINIPILDVCTRWNSTYKMVECIFESKEFLKKLVDD
jgi:hypothetical protein